jgi:hypothetical protein
MIELNTINQMKEEKTKKYEKKSINNRVEWYGWFTFS